MSKASKLSSFASSDLERAIMFCWRWFPGSFHDFKERVKWKRYSWSMDTIIQWQYNNIRLETQQHETNCMIWDRENWWLKINWSKQIWFELFLPRCFDLLLNTNFVVASLDFQVSFIQLMFLTNFTIVPLYQIYFLYHRIFLLKLK